MSLRPHAAAPGHAERMAAGDRSSGAGMRSAHVAGRDAGLRASSRGRFVAASGDSRTGSGDSPPPPAAARRSGGSSTGGSLRNSGGGASEGAWQALEERMAMQVMDLHHRHDAEQADADRILRANINRLDSRVHSLETQGVRADRRSAELASLTQALTEEQRTLLIRLDRLEESSKTGLGRGTTPARESNIAGEDALRRLGHVEREQRAVSTNLRLIVNVVEEAQHRTQARLRCFEELVEGRLQPVEEKLQLRSSSLSLAARRSYNGNSSPRGFRLSDPGQNAASALSSPSKLVDGALHVELTAAEQRATESLRAAQDLLRRCEWKGPEGARTGMYTPERFPGSSTACRSPARTSFDTIQDDVRGSHSMEDLKRRLDQLMTADVGYPGTRKEAVGLEDNGNFSQTLKAHNDAISELRSLVGRLANNLTPRTDALEVRAETLAQSVGDLNEKLRASSGHSLEQAMSQWRALQPRADALEARLEVHSQSVSEMQEKMRGLPSLEQVTTHCRNLAPRTEAVEARVHAITGAIEELHARMIALPSREQVVSLCGSARSAPTDSAQLEELKLKVQEVDAIVQILGLEAIFDYNLEGQGAILEVAKMSSLREVTRTVELQQASLIELRTHMADLWKRVEQMPTHMADLLKRVEQMPTHDQDLRSRMEELETKGTANPHLQQHEAMMADMRARLDEIPTHKQVLEAVRPHIDMNESQLTELHRKIELVQQGANSTMAVPPEVSAELADLRERISALPSHEQVVEFLRPYTLRSEAGVLDLHRKLNDLPTHEHIVNACRDAFSSHDARLTELHNRLDAVSTHDTRLAELHNRLDTLSTYDARMTDLHQRLEVLPTHDHIADRMESICRQSYGAHADKLEDLQAQLQKLSEAQPLQISASRPLEVESLERNLKEVSETVAELRMKLLHQPTHEQVSLTLAQSQETLARELRQEQTNHLKVLQSHVEKVREVPLTLAENHTGLANELRAEQEASLGELRARLDSLSSEVRVMSASSMDVIGEMRTRLQELAVETSMQTLQKACEVPEIGDDSSSLIPGGQQIMELHGAALPCGEEIWGNMLATPELAGEIKDLHSQCASLQEFVDQRIIVSVNQVEKQLPEVASKVDRLLWEYSERFAKVEENDVRLNHVLAKLGCNERRVKDCLDQVEQAPTLGQVRSMCREELRKYLEEVNFESVSEKVDSTLGAVAELRDRLAEQATEFEHFTRNVYIEEAVPLHTTLSEQELEDVVATAGSVKGQLESC